MNAMLEYFLLTLEIMFPLFVYIGIGKVVKSRNIMDEHSIGMLNGMLLNIFIPVKLFTDIMESDIINALQGDLMIFAICFTFIIYFLLIWLVPKMVNTKENASVVIQAIYRSNYILFGIAVIESMFQGEDVGVVSVMAAVIVPLFNILSVILFEKFRGNPDDETTSKVQLFARVLENNVVRAGIMGIILSFLGISIPEYIMLPFDTIGSCAAPLALISVGACISINVISSYKRELLILTLAKLIVLPLMAVGVGVAAGFNGIELAVILVLFGAPTATASFPMASRMGGNGELAGIAVAFTSLLSLGSLFIWIFMLNTLQLF